MFRFVCFLAAVAVCNAGIANYNGAAVIAPTITSEHQNVLRSYGNLQQVSYNSKTIDTPYSSVSKSDVRVSNPGIAVTHTQPLAYAAPAYQAYAAPAAHYHQPAQVISSYSAPATYQHAAPATYQHAAPATYQHAVPATYHHAAPATYHHAAPAAYAAQPLAYSAPAYHAKPLAYSAPVVAAAPAAKLLGVAYSPATSVSHMSYSAPLISYAW